MTDIEGKPFTDIIGELDNGRVLRELTEACYETIKAVMDTRKPGAIALTVAFNPSGIASIQAAAKIAKKVPEHDKNMTTFFVTRDFTLKRDDPDQHKLPLRAVREADNEPIKVAE